MKLPGAHDRFFERVARVEVASQPHVMKYVVDTLMEFGETPDEIVLTEEETGALRCNGRKTVSIRPTAGDDHVG